MVSWCKLYVLAAFKIESPSSLIAERIFALVSSEIGVDMLKNISVNKKKRHGIDRPFDTMSII